MRVQVSQIKVPLSSKQVALVIGGATAFLIILFTAIVSRGSNSMAMYVRDPAAEFGFTPLAGLVSHLGVFALLTAGVISIFASYQVRPKVGLLFWAGAFSLIIAVDDFFMIHDDLALRIGLSEIQVFAVYGVLALTILFVFRTSLTGKAHMGLYAAIALLAASVVADVTMTYSETQVVFEDSLKFLGLIVWSSYWVRRAHLTLAGVSWDGETHLHSALAHNRGVTRARSTAES